jgi:hypothetical protein
VKKKHFATLGLIVVLCVPFIPYKTVLVPKWRVQLVNENGIPFAGQMVDQFCRNYTYDVDPCSLAADDTRRYTDENGYVQFSEKSFSLSLVSRLSRACFSYLNTLFHGGVGTRIYLTSIDYPAGTAELKYLPENGLPTEKWVISSKNAFRP